MDHRTRKPIVALVITIGVALVVLFPPEAKTAQTRASIWRRSNDPGGLGSTQHWSRRRTQTGAHQCWFVEVLSHLADAGFVSPIVMAWTIAALIRLGTGSATVAHITAAGVMPSIVASTGASPEWVAMPLAPGRCFFTRQRCWILAGEVVLGTSTKDTFKTWSLLETVISVAALLIVLLASRVTAG